MRILISVAILCLCTVVFSTAARADDDVAAKAKYESGMRHFDLAEYEPALADFKDAYRNKPDPAFLYNIALCHLKLGHTDEAITFLQTYLLRAPDAKNREEVERKISELQATRRAAGDAAATSGKTLPPPPPVEPQKQAAADGRGDPFTPQTQPNAAAAPPAAPPTLATPSATAPPAIPEAEPILVPITPAAPAQVMPAPTSTPTSAPPPVMPDTTAALDFSSHNEAVPGPSGPMYKRWWFWTAVGVVAAGAVTVAIILAERDPTKIPSTGLGTQRALP